jgi:hypothetical protein
MLHKTLLWDLNSRSADYEEQVNNLLGCEAVRSGRRLSNVSEDRTDSIFKVKQYADHANSKQATVAHSSAPMMVVCSSKT